VLLEKSVSIKGSPKASTRANEVATHPIQDSRANLLAEGGNDTVQPYDTTQARSNSKVGVKFSTVSFYAIEHNS